MENKELTTPYILVLQGPPAAGKTTFARKYVKEHSKTIIVNRDSIRNSLGEYWVPNREDLVSKIEYYTAKTALESGWNVIIDATNLNSKTIAKWEGLADMMHVCIQYKSFWIPLHEALANDQNEDRDHKVGHKVIIDFYTKYNPELLTDEGWDNRYIRVPENPFLQKAIICDVDGTIALHQGRSPYDYEKCHTDKPELRVFELLECFINQGYMIIFVSGREKIGNSEEKTRFWIDQYFHHEYILIMREKNDHRPDKIVKEELYHNHIEPNYNVSAVFDDRNQCIDMWRSLGLLACQTYYGNF